MATRNMHNVQPKASWYSFWACRHRCVFMVTLQLLLTISVVPLLSPREGQGLADAADSEPPVCPPDSELQVSVDEDGLVFQDVVFQGSDPQIETEYDAGALSGWYALARGFVDTVKEENLPYDLIAKQINSSSVTYTVYGETPPPDAADGLDAFGLLRDFASWWAPILGVSVFGGVLAIAFCCTGCCFCCCRCCGYCGGSRRQSYSPHAGIIMLVFTIILSLFTLGLLAGTILTYFSNQRFYSSLDGFQDSVTGVVDEAIRYVNDTRNEADILLCQYDVVSQLAINEVQDAPERFSRVVQENYQQLVNPILNDLISISDVVTEVEDLLANISETTSVLQSLESDLKGNLSDIMSDLDLLNAACNSAVPAMDCSGIPPSGAFDSNVDYNSLPSVANELTEVTASLQTGNLAELARMGNETFNDLSQTIQTEVKDQIDVITKSIDEFSDDIVSEIRQNLTREINRIIDEEGVECTNDTPFLRRRRQQQFPSESEDGSGLEVNLVEIRDCYINAFFEELRKFDVYRYGVSVTFSTFTVLTILLVFTGVCFGLLGFRRDRKPSERSMCSHCGGIFLIIAVCVTFVVGTILLILCSITFFFGSNAQKVCQALEPTEDGVELFTEVLFDNEELWRGSVLGDALFNNRSISLGFSSILRDCEGDESLYQALRLDNLDLLDRLNIEEQVSSFNVSEFDDSGIQFSTDDFIPSTAFDSLNSFVDSGFNQIDYDVFRNQTLTPPVTFNVSEELSSLSAFSDNTSEALANQTEAIIKNLNHVNDVILPAINQQLAILSELIDRLQNSTSVLDSVQQLNESVNATLETLNNEGIASIRKEGTELLNTVLGYVTDYAEHVVDALENEIGGCETVYNIYVGLYNPICRTALDGLNGFWWSVGFCVLMFVPIIIFSVLTSNYYFRMKEDVTADTYTDYPMKTY